MFVKLLTDRNCAANIWLDGGDAWRRWRRLLAQDALHNPSPAQDGRGGSSVGGHLENRCLSHETATHTVLWQGCPPQGDALDGGQTIMGGEPLIEHREIRIHYIARR